ncbi:TetR family transcriptional regulator [Pseudomonas typographi]|uniref:TetR family transcriptional regulator n=1 Tax=Pseudomonas typographi TaxID=2715964 RepID=UPI00168A205F|nr:TetR family transcriptional regulator [Pseudomonas typographi]MBD1587567.1 TetR family transcriptional regulator [Pseudomonas typographi]
MHARSEQKRQTRQALLEATLQRVADGKSFASISLREVAKGAGIVPTGFYRHFADMDNLGLALVREVGDAFRDTIRLVRHNELEMGGLTDASVRIFLDAVQHHRSHFLFLAREQYGSSPRVRKGLRALRSDIGSDLAADLARMPRWQHLDRPALELMADLVVKTVFATLPELLDPEYADATGMSPAQKIRQQLRFIFVGAKHWPGLARLAP